MDPDARGSRHDHRVACRPTASSTSRTGRSAVVLRVYEDGSLGQLHLGRPAADRPVVSAPRSGPVRGVRRTASAIPSRSPTRRLAPATSASRRWSPPAPMAPPPLALRYRDHAIVAGKPSLEGLPSTYAEADTEAETLVVTLVDAPTGLEVDLRFTIFAGRPVIARERDHPRGRRGPRRPPDGDERVARPARCRLGHGRADRRVGSRGPRRRARARPGPPVRLEHARRLGGPAQPVPRPPPPDRG